MIRSMTGYSRVQVEQEGCTLSVSVKATNHRYLDLQVRLPDRLGPLEPFLRRLVLNHVSRGHVEISVSLEQVDRAQLELNRKMVETYAAACEQLRRQFGWKAEPDPIALLRIPGMVGVANGELSGQELEHLKSLLERVANESLRRLNEMRTREGETLELDLRDRLVRLEDLAKAIVKLAGRTPELYRGRLESRLKDMLGNLELDPARLAQEVAYLASRSDITEELIRFQSHLEQARRLLVPPPSQPEASRGKRQESAQDSGRSRVAGAEAGKKLDFLLQEMNREANTLLSKVSDVPEVGLEIARNAIEMKTEIEKLREQAQNIE